MRFFLGYIPLLGGGLGYAPSEVDELSLGDWNWYMEILQETREAEIRSFNGK